MSLNHDADAHKLAMRKYRIARMEMCPLAIWVW